MLCKSGGSGSIRSLRNRIHTGLLACWLRRGMQSARSGTTRRWDPMDSSFDLYPTLSKYTRRGASCSRSGQLRRMNGRCGVKIVLEGCPASKKNVLCGISEATEPVDVSGHITGGGIQNLMTYLIRKRELAAASGGEHLLVCTI